MNDTLLTIKEASEVLNVHWQTVRNYIKKGKLKSYKVGRTVRIKRKDLDNFIDPKAKDTGKKVEIELRYLLKDRKVLETRLLNLGAKIVYHGHVIDHWFIPKYIKSREQEEEWFDKNRGCGLRIREQDNGYTGKITTSIEAKRLTKEMNHNTFLEAEVTVDSYEDANSLMELMGRKEFLTIDKDRVVYKYKDFKICIDDIKDFKVGVEIEINTFKDRETALKKISRISKRLGLSEKDRAEKSITVLAFDKLAKYD